MIVSDRLCCVFFSLVCISLCLDEMRLISRGGDCQFCFEVGVVRHVASWMADGVQEIAYDI